MSARRGESSTRPPSVDPPLTSPLYLTFNADLNTPPYETVPITLANGKPGRGRACEICGKIITIGSKGSLYAFDLHKTACQQKTDSLARNRLTNIGDRARSLSTAPSTMSLSPLMIPGPSPALSLSGSPTSLSQSPIFSPAHSPSDITSDYDATDLEYSGPDPVPPVIAVNPPSDDQTPSHSRLSLPLSEALSPSCTGVIVQWKPGTIWETYPFPSHSFVRHPWHILEVCPPDHLRLRSADCTSTVSPGGIGSVCHNCIRIPETKSYLAIQNRAESARPHTSYHLLSYQQLSTVSRRMKKALDLARIKNVAMSRKLATSRRAVNDHQRLLRMLASHDVKRLKCVIGVALRRGCSTSTIIMRIEQAVSGLYQARGNYSERELDIGFLAKSLGGPKLLYALCRSHGLPAYRTITNHRHIPRLIPSGSTPVKEEISSNISSFFSPEQRPELPKCGHSLLIDGVAVDERGCYDRERNEVIGFCREHAVGVDRRVTNMAAIEYLSGLTQGQDASLHYGSEASVVAIAAHRSDHYQAVPLMVSTKCGAETGEDCAKWLKVVLDSWAFHEYGAQRNGPIWTIASDGESSLRNSRFSLCTDRNLDRSSPLGMKLARLPGLNLKTGPQDVTMSADYKHAFKRHATQLRTPGGFQVWTGICNRNQLFHFLTKLHGMSESRAHQLLDPADKQNVPKAVTLLQAVCNLRNFPSNLLLPSEQANLHRFNFLGEVLSSFLSPFIDLGMSLDRQVISLVKYAHLICACWIKHGNSFMSGALYADGQAIVKNIIFSLAKQQILDETQDFHIILDGTDRLEQVFSDARTQDHSRNFDILQLSQKLATASTINNIFLRNPDLNRGHARLSLTNASGVDHVNPKSCTGNLASGSVNIQALWASGQQEANVTLKHYFGEDAVIDFMKLFSDSSKDLLCPEGNYVGTTRPTDKPDNSISVTPGSVPTSTTPSVDSSDEENIENLTARAANIDIEDLLPSSPDQPIQNPTPTHFLPGPNGKEYYKGSIVSSYLHGGNRAKKVVERTLRARGVTLESLRESQDLNTTDVLTGDDAVIVGDLAATVVRVGEQVCLAVIHIIGFSLNGSRVDRVAIEVLEQQDSSLLVTGEVLEIVSMRSQDEPTNSLWAWSLSYLSSSGKGKSSKLTVKQTTFQFPGWLIIPLCPTFHPATSIHDHPSQPYTWAFEEATLNESLSQLRTFVEDKHPNQPHEALADLPSLSIDELPYRSGGDQECFIIDNLVPAQRAGILEPDTKVPCLICDKKYVLRNMRAHVGRHILYGACSQPDRTSQELGLEPCGFCGGDECTVRLNRTANECLKVVSSCRYAYPSLNYESAKFTSKTSPCTNVPIICPFCSSPDSTCFIWKYNGVVHMTVNHPDVRLTLEFLAQIYVSLQEAEHMKVDLDAMKSYRKSNNLMESDDLPEEVALAIGDKRSRALSASSAGSSRKSARFE